MRYAVVDTDVIRDAVRLACRAPSLHNSQPWRWLVEGDAVHLFLDAERAPRHTDTTGKEALIGCGAVLDHLRVAMAASGWRAHVERFPNPNNPDHLASVSFSPKGLTGIRNSSASDSSLVRALPSRTASRPGMTRTR